MHHFFFFPLPFMAGWDIEGERRKLTGEECED